MLQNLLPLAIVVGVLVICVPLAMGRAFKLGRIIAVAVILVVLSAPAMGMQVVDLASALGSEIIETATRGETEPVAAVEDLQWVEGDSIGTWSIRIREVRTECTPEGVRISLRGGDSHPVEHQHPDPIPMRLADGTETLSDVGSPGWATWLLDGHAWTMPHDATGPVTILIPARETPRLSTFDPAVATEAVEIRIDLPQVECGSEPE